ncbi:nef protein [Human immunodeficiency virus 2]|uniref:Protein Nef n=1 Tax=Human immunodeficiency virus 2 TaxID=11709 RepID=Q6H0K1_9HIV2|nr:nef protein [Human immunodeficiency virus 2]
MGGSISKKHSKRSGKLRERLLAARGENYGRLWGGLEDGFELYQGGSGKDLSSRFCEAQGQGYSEGEFMNTPWRTPATGKDKLQYKQQNMDDVDEEDNDLVGVAVRPRVALRTMTYKLAVDMSHFIKEKGGLDGIFYSQRRHRILDIYLENEEGIIPDWQNYTSGPGTRWPMCFGWLWKLEPVDANDKAQEDERLYLVGSAQTSCEEDHWGEALVWKFDSSLAYSYQAFIKCPEEFGSKSGLSEEEVKRRLTARGLPVKNC